MSEEQNLIDVLQENQEFYTEAVALAKKYNRELKSKPVSANDSHLRIDLIPKTVNMPKLTMNDVKGYAEFCMNVKFWIAENKQDIREIADNIDIFSHDLKQILNGNRLGSLSIYKRLSDLTGVPLDTLKESA